MKTISFLTLLIIFSLTFIGCEKKDDPISSKTELLTTHTWNFDELTTTSTDDEVKLSIALMSVLMEGSTIKFNTDNSYTMFLPNENSYGTWEFHLNETLIYFYPEIDEFYVAPVIKLTSTVFEFEQNIKFGKFENFDIIWKWVK